MHVSNAEASLEHLFRVFTMPEHKDSTLSQIEQHLSDNLSDFLSRHVVAKRTSLEEIEQDFNNAQLPLQPEFQGKMPLQYRIIDRLHKKWNPLKSTIKFKASTATVALLDDFFKTEFKDLDNIVKKEIFSKWFKN